MELKENALLAFRNEKKSDNHPDFKGQVNVEGKYYDIAFWEKEGAKGRYLSGKVSEPWKKPAEPPEGNYQRTGKYDNPPAKIEDQDESGLPF